MTEVPKVEYLNAGVKDDAKFYEMYDLIKEDVWELTGWMHRLEDYIEDDRARVNRTAIIDTIELLKINMTELLDFINK